MEGDGVLAMAQALKEAGLAFMVNGGCKRNSYEFNHGSLTRQHWRTSQAGQTPNIAYRNDYQTSHCQVSSNSPSRIGLHTCRPYFPSPTRYVPNKMGYRSNAYNLARGYQSSVVITNTPYRLKSSTLGSGNAFISSLRKYPKSPERSISADFIQRLLTYTHQKSSILKHTHASRSQRSIRRRSRDLTRKPSPMFVRRSRAKQSTCRAVSPDTLDLQSALLGREVSRCIDASYDYLKSPVKRLSPTRVSEVRYLNDITRFVRDSLRSLGSTDYEPCPYLSHRLMEHKKRCPKAKNKTGSGSNIRTESTVNDAGAQTSRPNNENTILRSPRYGCMMASQSVQANNQEQDRCDCESPGFSLRKLRFLPLRMCDEATCSESSEYHEWLDKKLKEIINDWVKTIPVSEDFDDNDRAVRKAIARELRAKILRLISEDKLNDNVKDVIINSIDNMPMWYPDDDQKKFHEKIATNLMNSLNDLGSNLKMFDMLFDEWFEELKLKPVDERGRELNKERIKKQLAHSIKPIVIDRIIEDELKTNLKNETLNIVEELPLDVGGNQNQYFKEVADKLIDSFNKTDREKVLEKKRKSYDSRNYSDKESPKRRSRNSNDSSASNRRRNSGNTKDINVSLTLSGQPSYDNKDTKPKVYAMNNLICDWMSTIPKLTEVCKENNECVKQLAIKLVEIEDKFKNEDMKLEALREEVIAWLGDIVENKRLEMKPKSILRLTNDLVNKIEKVYKEPLEEIVRKEDSNYSLDYFDDDDVCGLLQEIDDLPEELLKPKHQGTIMKVVKGFTDSQDATDEELKFKFQGPVQDWLDNALDEENLKLDARTKSFVIGDLLQRLCDAKSGNYELNSLEDEFNREIFDWVVNIPQIAQVKYQKDYQNIVRNLAKDLNFLQRRHGVDASDARELILDKITDFLETTLEKEGEQIDESEKKMLLDDLMNNLIRKTKKHSVAAIYRQAITNWLDNVPELEEITDKDEYQRPIAKLADKIAELNKEAETDATVKNEIKDDVKHWLAKIAEKEKLQLNPDKTDEIVEKLMDFINTINENRTDVQARNFENEIMKWLDNIPEIANIANNETFKNEIKDLAKDINMFQRRHGIDATDMRDTILNRLRGFLDDALEVEGGHLSEEDKDKFLNKLLRNLIETSKKPDETVKDKILVEVKDWLDNIPQLANASKSKDTKEMTRSLVGDLNELHEDGLENLDVREQFLDRIKKFLNRVCDKENVKLSGKAKRVLTDNLMERLENMILKPSEIKQEELVEEEEESDDDIPHWLDDVPGLDEAIKKGEYKEHNTLTMIASIMSLSDIKYDFGEEINKYFDINAPRYMMTEYEQILFDKLSKKLLLLYDDERIRYEIENDIKDYLDVICERRRKYLDSKTKNLIAKRLIERARFRLDHDRVAYDTSKNLIKSLQTWSSLLSVNSGKDDTESILCGRLDKRYANRKKWNKDIGFQFSSSETDSISRSPSPSKLLKNRQKMNTYNFVSKHPFSTRSSPSPNRRAVAEDSIQDTSGKATTSAEVQQKSYANISGTHYAEDKPLLMPNTSKDISYKTYPINNLEGNKGNPFTKVYYTDNKTGKTNDMKNHYSKLEKDAKRSITNVIEKGKYKLTTANSNQVKREIIDVLKEKVGLTELDAWPLAEHIIKKAKTIFKGDEYDLREIIRDEIRDVLDEAGITSHRDELEQSLTDLLAHEIRSGKVDDHTHHTVNNILKSADVYDPDYLTSQLMERANEIHEKVRSNKLGIKITPDTFRNIAQSEVTEFVEGRVDELTPSLKRRISDATKPIIEKLENIISDPSKTPEDKTYDMKANLENFLRNLSIDKSEGEDNMADKLIARLYARMNPARTRLNDNEPPIFNMATQERRYAETSQSPTEKQELVKLAALKITDSLDQSNLPSLSNKESKSPNYNRRMSIAIPKQLSGETERVGSNLNIFPISDFNAPQNVRSNSNFGANSGGQNRRNSSNAGRKTSNNSNAGVPNNTTGNKMPPIKTDNKKLYHYTKNIKDPQSKPGDDPIEKELLDLLSTKIPALTPKDMGNMKVATHQLVQIAKRLDADTDLTIDDKIVQLKGSITNYLRLIPLINENKKDELATTILSKLEIKLFHKGFASSTPRQSIQDSNVLKTNEQCYLNQLRNIIENWVSELPIIQDSIQDINLKRDMIENLVTDIDKRQKYLQLNLETKPCCEEELENLKYQVFRWLNKFLDIDDLSPFLSNIQDLMDRIKRVPVPKLVKPSSKAMQEEIFKFVEQMPPHLLASDDRTYQQQGIKELADRLLVDVEKSDANARVETALRNWIPKMFTGSVQDLNRLADMLRSTLKKKGLLESKVDKAHKKATDILNDTIENWCDDLPLYSNSEEQDQVRKMKTNLSHKLIHKITQFNLDPEIFNDEFLYEDMVSDEIDKLTEWLPKNPELDKYLPALKKDLVSQIKFARQNIIEEIAGQAYKFLLRDIISNTLRTPEVLTTEELASLELVKENLIDAFISVHYVCDSIEGKRLLRERIAQEINNYCYDFFRRFPMASINATKINCELYEALLNVPIPGDGSIRNEVEQLYIKNIIKEWMTELPLREETNRELLTRTKMITVLAKRLHEIEQEKDFDPDLDTNTKMCDEIQKTMKKLALKPVRESDVPKMALKLLEKLNQTEEYRHSCTIVDTVNNKTTDDPNYPCSSRQFLNTSKCGLSLSDKVHLQKIRERVQARMSCPKDACVNPPIDTGSQVDLNAHRQCLNPVYDTCSGKRLIPNICSWADRISPNLSQSSTQTARCMNASSQEISPQVIIREHCWDSPETVGPRRSYEVSPKTSCKASAYKNNLRDTGTQDIIPQHKDQSCQCQCDKCCETRRSTQKPLTSSDGIDNPTSYESWEAERPSAKRIRTKRCRTRCRDFGEYSRRDDERAYWDESRPVLRPNILNIPGEAEAFKRMRKCACEEKHKPQRNHDEITCDQFRLCPKCLNKKCPHPSYMYFR